MIHKYDPDFLDSCALVYMKTFSAPPWNENWSVSTARKYLAEFSDAPRFVGFVYSLSDKVIGAAFCHAKTWVCGEELFIDEFFISPDFQHKGFGTELMKTVEKYATDSGLTSVVLLTSCDKPSLGFYKALGFECATQMRFMFKDM